MYRGSLRASQLMEKYVDKGSAEPWFAPPPASEPIPLTLQQEVALLTLRGRDHATQVIKAMRAKGATWAREEDYAALVPHGLAVRNKWRSHSITPIGHRYANALTRTRASELGIRLTTYRRARSGPQRINCMSEGGNG